MPGSFFDSPTDAVVARDFVNDEHWQGTYEALNAAGFNLDQFDGESGPLAIVRSLGNALAAIEQGAIRPSENQKQRIQKAWERSLDRLFGKVASARQVLEESGHGHCFFDVAMLNPDYLPAVKTEHPDGGVSFSFRGTPSQHMPYVAVSADRLREDPGLSTHIAVYLAYQERI